VSIVAHTKYLPIFLTDSSAAEQKIWLIKVQQGPVNLDDKKAVKSSPYLLVISRTIGAYSYWSFSSRLN
jgi:hypothetical protein